MRMLSWTLALAATCLFAAIAPASAATVTYAGRTSVTYDVVDLGMGEFDGIVIGEVSDGLDTFKFELSAFVNFIDPPVGDLFITVLGGGAEMLGGMLESIEVGADYIVLIFGDLSGSASAMFGGKARVLFTDFSWNSPYGVASVTVSPIPLPATALLLLSGFAGMMVSTRTRKAA